MTTCQICARAIKAKTGLVAHHGYTRPGDGWQTSSCPGARHLPFEVSRERLGWYIEIVEGELKSAQERLRAAEAGETPVHVFHRVDRMAYRATWNPIAQGTEATSYQRRSWLSHLEAGLRGVERSLKELQARYDSWSAAS